QAVGRLFRLELQDLSAGLGTQAVLSAKMGTVFTFLLPYGHGPSFVFLRSLTVQLRPGELLQQPRSRSPTGDRIAVLFCCSALGRYWHKADIPGCLLFVRFRSEADIPRGWRRVDPTRLVESECGAVAVGRTYLFPPLSSGGALVVQP